MFIESSCGHAIKEMQKYDPYFDINDLTIEAKEVFKEFFCNYLAGNLEYLEKVSGQQALAVSKAEIKRRTTEGWQYKYDDILDIGESLLQGGMIPEKQNPQFTYTIQVQEINCKVSAKDENEITEGGEDSIMSSTYRIVLSRHDEPDIALTGHYWEIVEFNKVGEVAQLV